MAGPRPGFTVTGGGVLYVGRPGNFFDEPKPGWLGEYFGGTPLGRSCAGTLGASQRATDTLRNVRNRYREHMAILLIKG